MMSVTYKQATDRQLVSNIIKQHIDELDDYSVTALFASLLDGKWGHDTVVKALHTLGGDIPHLHDVEAKLKELGILEQVHGITAFTEAFRTDLVLYTTDLLKRMPAHMLPRTEKVADWTAATNTDLNINFVKVAQKYLARFTPANMPNVFASVNKAQAVPFTINAAIIPHMKAQLASFSIDHANMSKAEILTAVQNHTRTTAQLALIESLAHAEELYFTITLDYRGRQYYRGGLVTPQGDDFCKAAFSFANKPALGTDGLTGLAIHYANVYGNDKMSLTDRVKWAKGEGLKLANRISKGYYPVEADKPFQTIVAGAEFARIHRLVEVGATLEDITSGIVCHTDGTCNGSQHGAALVGHRGTAEAVNCTASDWDAIPSDVYNLANESLKPLITEYQGLYNAACKMGRSLMKKPVMVTGYGAGIKAVISGMQEVIAGSKLSNEEITAALQDIEHNIDQISELVAAALAEHIGAVMAITKELQNKVNGNKVIAWKCADGFIAIQALRAKNIEDRTYKGSAQYAIRTDKGIHEGSMKQAISPNFIHSIDATHLRKTVLAAPFDMVTVHDSYGSAPANFLTMNKIIREQFIETHNFNWFGVFSDCNSTTIDLAKGDYSHVEVINSAYFFS